MLSSWSLGLDSHLWSIFQFWVLLQKEGRVQEVDIYMSATAFINLAQRVVGTIWKDFGPWSWATTILISITYLYSWNLQKHNNIILLESSCHETHYFHFKLCQFWIQAILPTSKFSIIFVTLRQLFWSVSNNYRTFKLKKIDGTIACMKFTFTTY